MGGTRWGGLSINRRHVLFALLVGASLIASCRGAASHTVEVAGDLTEEQKSYYEQVFQQYDMDHDGYITMEENIEQDKAIAEEQNKPFDEVCTLHA
jgi:hypothetical protein